MERDKHVAVVTDSGTSMLPKSPEAVNLGVTVVPLEIKFWENTPSGAKFVPYSDADVSTEDFYQRMKSSKKLPETTGALPGNFVKAFRNLRERHESIISIDITSKESGVYQSAIDAKNVVQNEKGPDVTIKVTDSKLVTLATWFGVEAGALASMKGASLKEVEDEVLEAISKSQLFVTLETFNNLFKGGRAHEIAKAILAKVFSIHPIIGFVNGKIETLAKENSVQNAREKMIQMVGDSGKLVKLAILHTNTPFLARKIKMELKNLFSGNIPIYNVKGALAVHAGEGAVGIAFQKA